METIKKGKMEVYDMQQFKLHVYDERTELRDLSYIIEGTDGLVLLEHPLFKDHIEEFNAYLKELGKKVVKVIADYHVGGFADIPSDEFIMIQGMPEFVESPMYAGMMERFTNMFGDAIDNRPHPKGALVAIGSTEEWVGITFKFVAGPAADFPAAGIIIGDKVFYSHWAPSKSHVKSFQITSVDAIQTWIDFYEKENQSSCEYFIGSHGGVATKADLTFKIDYLKKLADLHKTCADKTAFVKALKESYPGIDGEDGIEALAEVLYP